MFRLLALSTVAAIALLACQSTGSAGSYSAAASKTSSAVPAGLTDYGYPDVLATVYLDPGQQGKVVVPDQYATGHVRGYMTITIPANAFSVPVRFDVLAGSNRNWDKVVKSDLTVVANFAYRVIDLKTGKLIDKFDHPLTYSVTDSMINANSVYWATTATSPVKLIDANKASKISGSTLEHLTPVSTVGWIVTTPKANVAGMM